MTNTYKFDIVQIFTSGSDKLVRKIEFSLIAYSGNLNTFIIEDIDIPNISSIIIPYNKLDKDIMIGWVIKFLGEEKIKQMKSELDIRLEEMEKHFAQFEDSNKNDFLNPTLPPYAKQDIPKDAIALIPKDIISTNDK